MDNSYIESQYYETYIMKAYSIKDREKNGARLENMKNLITNEAGKGVDYLKHHKLLAAVKKYMTRATKKALTYKMEKADKESFKLFLTQIDEATASDELLSVCKTGVELLLKYTPNS